MRKHILDRLADAAEAERPMRLSVDDVLTLVDEFADLQLAREFEAVMFDRIICEMRGETSKLTH